LFFTFSGFVACGVFIVWLGLLMRGLAQGLHSSRRLAPSTVSVSSSIMDGRLCDVFRETILKLDLQVDLVNARAEIISATINTIDLLQF